MKTGALVRFPTEDYTWCYTKVPGSKCRAGTRDGAMGGAMGGARHWSTSQYCCKGNTDPQTLFTLTKSHQDVGHQVTTIGIQHLCSSSGMEA
ncbi:hypothetical protein NHX12_030578 [Muraenolepis orangiensis]|uniref:Uncharacterized protein n=1 Tax=Muraenolepis orangiensis TaxID=630683 RepID=A0A9Q0IJI4_9TELE|nr:hypothetical protein NHX12_030578 [Muraenolepis orangiensis]